MCPDICDLHSSDTCVYSIINRNNHFILYRKLGFCARLQIFLRIQLKIMYIVSV